MHVGPAPLPAEEGWTCFYFPGEGDDGWSWDIEHVLRSLNQASRLLRRAPLP